MRVARACVFALLVTAAAVRLASAAPEVRVGIETARDRATWHFDNPSTYDTTTPVPHFFEQHYVLDNTWLVGTIGWRAGLEWQTQVGVTPTREALATDYDTFVDPGAVPSIT